MLLTILAFTLHSITEETKMKIIKIIIIIIVVIVAALLLTAAFAPKEYAVSRSVTINADKQEVFEYVRFLKNQDNYSVWSEMDPDMNKTFTGTDGTVGFTSAWSSDNKDVGKGEQEITGIIAGQRVEFELRFMEPFEATDMAYITTEPEGDATKTTWGFDGKMSYPMNLMLLFMNFDEVLGSDLQNGLENLKEILEAPAAEEIKENI
jgi:hypothetical protein